MAASIWGNSSDITLTCWRITNFKFLMTAPIFVLICFWRASGLAFLLSLNILLTRDYCILTRVEIFHIIAFLFFSFFQLATPSKNFNPGLKSHYNQPLKLSYPRNFVALRKHWLLMWSAGWCTTNKLTCDLLRLTFENFISDAFDSEWVPRIVLVYQVSFYDVTPSQ